VRYARSVTASLMRGKPLAERIRSEVAAEVAALGSIGIVTVLVGDDPASQVYIRLKHEAATKAGMRATDLRLPDDVSEAALVAKVEELSQDDEVDALLVQLPLPAHIDEARVIRAIAPLKDVDGLHPFNAGQLYLGRPTLVGATPVGVLALLREHGIELDGTRAVVIGRSDIVGKPLLHLLMQANATVTLCHSHTRDLARHTLDAEVLVVAVGVPALVSPDMVKAGSVVIDVGMNRTDAGLVGDVDPGAADVAALMTPVPGGVGPMTIACLLQNAIRCARFRRGELAYPA
jgi:methylenetetrahydrofolate dehydrogenase (NADP+) / methenyltetrahydrofolate cyclohydrolase